jgi:hypothetical protein
VGAGAETADPLLKIGQGDPAVQDEYISALRDVSFEVWMQSDKGLKKTAIDQRKMISTSSMRLKSWSIVAILRLNCLAMAC